MGGLWSIVADFFVGVWRSWYQSQEEKKAGATEQALKQEKADDEVVAKAGAARDAAGAPGVPDNPADFRD